MRISDLSSDVVSSDRDRAGARNRIDIAAGHGGDPRQMLHRVEGGSLRRQHRPRTAYETHQTGAGSHPRALLHKPLDPDIGVKRTKEGLGDRQPRHYNGIAADRKSTRLNSSP